MGRAYRYFLGNCCFHIVEQRVIGGGGMGHSPSTMGEATTRLSRRLRPCQKHLLIYFFRIVGALRVNNGASK